jgi:hypothetical protein
LQIKIREVGRGLLQNEKIFREVIMNAAQSVQDKSGINE